MRFSADSTASNFDAGVAALVSMNGTAHGRQQHSRRHDHRDQHLEQGAPGAGPSRVHDSPNSILVNSTATDPGIGHSMRHRVLTHRARSAAARGDGAQQSPSRQLPIVRDPAPTRHEPLSVAFVHRSSRSTWRCPPASLTKRKPAGQPPRISASGGCAPSSLARPPQVESLRLSVAA